MTMLSNTPDLLTGLVVAVTSRPVATTSLAEDTAVGATTITVIDNATILPGDTLRLTDSDDPTVTETVEVDDLPGEETVALAAPLVHAYTATARVSREPAALETVASVSFDDDSDPLPVPVEAALAVQLLRGIRDRGYAELVRVDRVAGELRIVDIIGRYPTVDGDFVALDGVPIGDILADLNNDLDNLNTVILPQLQVDLAANASALIQLNTVTLPNLQSSLAGLSGLFPITGTSISNGAISTPQLATNAVTADKIIANAVGADKIAANSIGAGHIQANSIGADKIIANSIGANQIAANSIGADKIVANSIGADKIAANAITADKIAANAINGKVIVGSYLYGGAITGSYFNGGTYRSIPDSENGVSVVIDNGTIEVRSVNNNPNAYTPVRIGPSGINVQLADIHALNLYQDSESGGGTTEVRMGNSGRVNRFGSSRKIKDDITPLSLETARTMLRVEEVTYRRKVDPRYPDEVDNTIYPGVIAEQAVEVGADLWVSHNEAGEANGFRYSEMPVAHNLILRDHDERLAALEAALA